MDEQPKKSDMVFISTSSDIQTYNIRRVSAYLKNHGFNTKIIFLPQPFSKRYSDKVLKQVVSLCEDTKLIGISLMSNYWFNALQLIDTLKEKYDIPIIGGGSHPSVDPEGCMEKVDMICVGEGDDTLLQLLTKIKNNDDNFEGIPNLQYRKNGSIIKNQLARFEKTDEIKIPDFDLEDHYILFQEKVQPMTYNLFRYFHGETYTTQFAFGCPFVCSFCIHNVYNKRFQFEFRKRKIEVVLDELKYIKKKFPFMEKLRIEDDTFFFYSKEEMEYFRDEYKKYVSMPIYVCGGQPMVIKEELMKPMVEAGMYRIRMGIQTFTPRIAKLYQRHYPKAKILEACRVINSFKGLQVSYDFIIDNPWETEEETIETLRCITEMPRPFTLSVFSLTFFPGPDLYIKALQDGLVKDSNEAVKKGYYGVKPTYLNSLFFIFDVAWLPKKFKLFLLKDNVRKSKFAPLIISAIRVYRTLRNKKAIAVFMLDYVKKFDVNRVVFSIKKYISDKTSYSSYIKADEGV